MTILSPDGVRELTHSVDFADRVTLAQSHEELRHKLRDVLDILNSPGHLVMDPDTLQWIGYRAGVEVCRSHDPENARQLVIQAIIQAAKAEIEEALDNAAES